MSMTIHFSGAEVAKHRKLLLAEGAPSLALNLSAYFANRQSPILKDVYEGLPMVVYSPEGGLDQNRVDSFLAENADAFSMIYGLRTDHPNYVPVWRGGNINDFYAMAEPLSRVGVSEDVALDSDLIRYVFAFCRTNGIGLVTSSSKSNVLVHPWSEVISGAWIASMKHFELQVWDGSTVRRYSKAAKTNAITKHRGQIIALGGDPDAIADDAGDDQVRVAIRSWIIFGARDAKVVAIAPDAEPAETAPEATRAIAIRPVARDRVMLPVLAETVTPAETDDGVPSRSIGVSHSLLRSCSACNLSQLCPEFEHGSTCAYSIPITIRSKHDLEHVKASMLEMQTGRVMMARFAEDLASQGIDPQVGKEMDRLFGMMESIQRGNVVTERIQIEATSSSGVISRLFGERAGAANVALATPVPSAAITEAILDADVVDEP